MYQILNTGLNKIAYISLLLLATQAFANVDINITEEQYLSNILKNIDTNNDYDSNATTWLSVAEKQTQKHNKELLLKELSQYKKSEVQWLVDWLQSLPITGRTTIPVSDYKLMEANLNLNPYLMRGDVVKLLNKKNTINVIASNGQVCELPFVAGKTAKAYTKACKLRVNYVYLINANGKVSREEFGAWQNQNKTKITAGSTLWVPKGLNKLPDIFNESIAKIIATQSTNFNLPTPLKTSKISAQKQQELINKKEQTNHDMGSSYSDWGMTGLMQTPTARMQEAGEVALTVAKNDPYTLYTMAIQPTDNLEVGFRFTDIGDRPYGPADDDGDKSLKDKSLSVKLKVLDESKYLPSVAVGMRDPLGTGLFDGEYVVANKRFKNIDASVGVGFGYLGNRKNLSNPLGSVHENYKTRKSDNPSTGGQANYKNWFTGKGALFGGLLWQTPYEPLSVKVEYDGNDYSQEPSAKGKLETKSPINLGLQWQTDDVNLNVGYERGNQVTAGITLHDNIATTVPALKTQLPTYLKAFDKVASMSSNVDFDSFKNGSKKQNAKFKKQLSRVTGLNVVDIINNKDELRVVVDGDVGIYVRKKIDRGIKLLNQIANANIKTFKIDIQGQNEPLKTIVINREDWVLSNNKYLSPAFAHQPMQEQSAVQELTADNRKISYYIRPNLEQSFGGPDGYLYALDLNAGVNIPLWKNAWVDAEGKFNIHNNYDEFDYTGPSKLPRVRTNIQKYSTTSNTKLSHAQINQLYKVMPNVFALGYAGYLEPMYAGVGGEILYRPYNSNWAVGLDVNSVKQRDFDQGFGLQDYHANTGHVNLYWDTDWKGVEVKAKAGKYLAGDVGATLDLSKKFTNGAKMGAWATKTDVSSEEFGEGSFDKGIYFSMPLDALVENFSKDSLGFTWHPLLRDGGASLNRKNTLWNLTKAYDPKLLEYKTKTW